MEKTMLIPRPFYELGNEEIEKKRIIGQIETYVFKFLSNEFVENGFQWIMPVIFSKATDPLWPDPGASIEKRIEAEIYGTSVKVMQSMIVHKIVTCSILYDKLFTFSPNIRIEKKERALTGLHAYEFTQLDFEIRDASSNDIMKFVEYVLYKLKKNIEKDFEGSIQNDSFFDMVRPPWKVYDMEDLKNEYGNDWEKIVEKFDEPIWVVNIPREFYDYEDFDTGRWDNYDLYLPGLGEVLSGAKREFTYLKMKEKILRDGLNENNFKIILELAKDRRILPCAGAGIGIERLLKWITNVDHIGMVQLFPRIPGIVYDL
ncbi:MAG: asparagine synthetase A [Thermoplasmata archaeon]